MDDRKPPDTNVVRLRRNGNPSDEERQRLASTIFAEQDEVGTFSRGNLVPPARATPPPSDEPSPAADPFFEQFQHIDNDPVSLNLSGPTDAPSTAGVQYVTATAAAGPSGVQGITCVVDGAPAQSYTGASAQVPVSGIGEHTVRCAAANNAVNPTGGHGWSAWATWSVSIRQPTISGIGFSKLVDPMLCHRVRKRVKVPARWVTVRRHHKRTRVRKRAHTKSVTVAHCHPRIVRRKIFVWATVTRHGRKVRVRHAKWIRVVVMPHVVTHTSKRVTHGKWTTVNGWLGMPNGTALAGRPSRC